MKIGIGLPNPVPGTPGQNLVEWAVRAEQHGFSGLATIDRIAYPSYDSLMTLAAAAGATSRIELMTNILLAPAYSPVLLAKSTASLDQLSTGRLTLGLAAGGGGPQMAAPFADRVRAASSAAGRPGEPRLAALSYFSLGADVEEDSRVYLRDYYAVLGSYGTRSRSQPCVRATRSRP